MAKKTDWQDVSSYSRDDKVREPKTFEWRAPGIRVVVTRHVHFGPGVWTTSCHDIGFGPHALTATDLDEAKAEALALVRARVQLMLRGLGGDR